MRILQDLEPQEIFYFFEKITHIPRGSGNIGQISKFLARFAKSRGLKYEQDKFGNVIIWKDGTAGYEKSAPVILQGHMDMVCEKEPGNPIDMATEGVEIEVQDGVIKAKGTTLGGDDGIALAYCLTLLDSDEIPHPPLEVVFTVDEETNCSGAENLDASLLKSRTLINLDSEDEGVLIISCAGGTSMNAALPATRKKAAGTLMRLDIKGLTGGHSGQEIHKGRASANHLLGRLLYEVYRKYPFNLVLAEGGTKQNAIPQTAAAEFVTEHPDETRKIIEKAGRALSAEYRVTDPDLAVSISEGKSALEPMDDTSTKNAITAMACLPIGVERMSADIEGLVETSSNFGLLRTDEEKITMVVLVRSSVDSAKQDLCQRIEALVTGLGAVSCEQTDSYPAWEYSVQSPLRDLTVRIFEKMYGHAPRVEAIHAGLECGIFAGKMPGLDAVSIGPDLRYVHTTKETLDIESAKRTWEYLLEILKALK